MGTRGGELVCLDRFLLTVRQRDLSAVRRDDEPARDGTVPIQLDLDGSDAGSRPCSVCATIRSHGISARGPAARGELESFEDLTVQTLVDERSEGQHRRDARDDETGGDQCSDGDDELAPQSPPVSDHRAGLIVYPTPRTVWMSGSPIVSIFLRR